MIKFKNTTEKESFKNMIEFQGLKIKPIQALYDNQKQWNITDSFGNEWNVVFTGNVDELYIYNVPHFGCDKPFRVDFIMNGNNVEIHIIINHIGRVFTRFGINIMCQLFLSQTIHIQDFL